MIVAMWKGLSSVHLIAARCQMGKRRTEQTLETLLMTVKHGSIFPNSVRQFTTLPTIKKSHQQDLILCLVTFINIEDPYESDSLSVPPREEEGAGHGATRSVEDETTKVLHNDRGAASDDENNHMRFSTTPDEYETLSNSGPDGDVRDNLLTLRLLRHFKEGPGQW